MKYCETCKYYFHTPNILGGIAECILAEKKLFALTKNKACDLYEPTNTDKLKAQNDYYNKHLDGALQIKNN